MLSLSVLWSEDGGPPRPGRLDLSERGLTLAGGSRLTPERHEIGLGEIGSVRMGRRMAERLSGRAALVLALHDGRAFLITSLSAAGTLHELAERLWGLLGPRPEPQPDAT
jgi:hypothetical protein